MSIFKNIFGSKIDSNAIKVLTPESFRDKIESKNIQLIDVRTATEFKSGFIKNAINIDFFSKSFNTNIEKLDKNKAIYVYCRSGNRSNKTCRKLAALGFEEIYDLQGGILNYK